MMWPAGRSVCSPRLDDRWDSPPDPVRVIPCGARWQVVGFVQTLRNNASDLFDQAITQMQVGTYLARPFGRHLPRLFGR